jgi:glycosyltransferase involved in cell wall biosynthesis
MAYRFGFVMEQTLGQVTHTQNFQHWVAQDPSITATWMLVVYAVDDAWASVPVIGRNWTLRASLEARRQVREALRSQAFDALFFHTQVTALFAHRLMREIPSIVSMDATPLNFDTIGGPYAHSPGAGPIESVKNALTRRSFSRACGLVVWHEWGKRSLVADYAAPAEKVAVIPPGIDLEQWNFARPDTPREGLVRLLFVGGDFVRKGGRTLLAAMHQGLAATCELDIVTRDDVDTDGLPNVRVHHGLGPNAPQLMALYARADVFVFPTEADVLPLAIMEAMAASLPLVTTNVGAIAEEVLDGVTGLVVEPGNVDSLLQATTRLVKDTELRRTMGAAARRTAQERFNGSLNYPRVLEIMKRCADRSRPPRH